MRTDIHRPSAIIPTDYEFVAFEHMQINGMSDCYAVMENRRRIEAHMRMTGGTYSNHEHGGNCMVCGNANAIWTILFYHAKSNSYVRTGQDCANKIEMCYGDFNAFRRAIENALEAKAGKKKAEAYLNQINLPSAWELYTREYNQAKPFTKFEETVRDIVSKLVQYGRLTDAQEKFLNKLVTDLIPNEASRLAQREIEHQNAPDVPAMAGRTKIEGTVISVKHVDSDFGPVTKILVKHDSGWKAYGSIMQVGFQQDCPSFPQECTCGFVHYNNPIYPTVGSKIRFMARLQASEKDSKFGFFSRPTKGELI